jgi:hypothetical protein
MPTYANGLTATNGIWVMAIPSKTKKNRCAGYTDNVRYGKQLRCKRTFMGLGHGERNMFCFHHATQKLKLSYDFKPLNSYMDTIPKNMVREKVNGVAIMAWKQLPKNWFIQ